MFDGDDKLFVSLLPKVRTYIEYGCGQSTVFVAQNTNAVIYSVDTSQVWSTNTKQQIHRSNVNIHWIDVGPIGDWGYPLSFQYRSQFRLYCEWPWQQTTLADLVLIDGRFRVACFLSVLKHAAEGTKIIIDDYNNRPMYHVAEEFLPKLDTHGRQALFQTTKDCKWMISDQLIDNFVNVMG
jgi:hypothetical protein